MANVTEEKAGPPCILCGGAAFTWGIARDKTQLEFIAGNTMWQQHKTVWPTKIRARACDTCGNVALFLDKG